MGAGPIFTGMCNCHQFLHQTGVRTGFSLWSNPALASLDAHCAEEIQKRMPAQVCGARDLVDDGELHAHCDVAYSGLFSLRSTQGQPRGAEAVCIQPTSRAREHRELPALASSPSPALNLRQSRVPLWAFRGILPEARCIRRPLRTPRDGRDDPGTIPRGAALDIHGSAPTSPMIPPELTQRRLVFRATQAASVEMSGLAEEEEPRPSAKLGRGSLRAIGLC